MGHLANLVLALLAVGLADELGPLGPIRPELVPLVLFAPYAFVPWIRGRVRRGAHRDATIAINALRRAPLFVQLVADLAFGYGAWIALLHGPTDLPPGWPTAWDLLRFAPFVIGTLTSLDATARVHGDRAAGRRWWRFQVRSFFGAALPIGVFVVADALIALQPGWAWSIQGVEAYSALHTFSLLSLLAISVPVLLRYAWGAQVLPESPARRVIELVSERADFRCREVLLWSTGRSMANAMIVGVLPNTRRVFFSDSLLESLPPRELAAVTAHEIGHAKRGHIMLFLALALGAFGALDSLSRLWDVAWPVPFEIGVLAILGLGALAFGWLSRRFELEADLFATRVTGDPTAIGDALLRLGGRLRDVAGGATSRPARDAFLRRASLDPHFLRAFERRMRLVRVAVVLVFLAGFGGSLFGKFGDYDLERYHVALWQGDLVTAEARAAQLELGVSERATLHAAAEELGSASELPRAACAARIRESADAIAAGLTRPYDPAWFDAVWRLDVAAAMGDEPAERVLEIARRYAEGDESAAEDLPARWRAGIESLAALTR